MGDSPGLAKCPDAGALRSDVLGAVAAEFFLLGPSGRVDGPSSFRHRLALLTDPDRESSFHPHHAARLFLLGLPVRGKVRNAHSAAEDWGGTVRNSGVLFYHCDDPNAHRC